MSMENILNITLVMEYGKIQMEDIQVGEWSNNTDLIYKGTAYNSHSICVIDADENSIYNSQLIM